MATKEIARDWSIIVVGDFAVHKGRVTPPDANVKADAYASQDISGLHATSVYFMCVTKISIKSQESYLANTRL